MAEIHIRQATFDDAKLLTDLAYTTFWDAFAHHPKNAPEDLNHYMRQAFTLDQTTAELADERNTFLVAEIDGEPAGYAKVTLDSTEEGITGTRPIELNRLYAHQRFLGQGVGPALMDACLDLGRGENCDVMWLGVWEYNPRAQKFYEKNGFQVVGRHVFMLGSDAQIDLLMQRGL